VGLIPTVKGDTRQMFQQFEAAKARENLAVHRMAMKKMPPHTVHRGKRAAFNACPV